MQVMLEFEGRPYELLPPLEGWEVPAEEAPLRPLTSALCPRNMLLLFLAGALYFAAEHMPTLMHLLQCAPYQGLRIAQAM